ncbi:putative L-asparaginase 4 [Fusarium oxysporum f. sp. albedinis]|nr:putative L-asparaginase 4 [Fusarium oxysporum f. sp. albedinis]
MSLTLKGPIVRIGPNKCSVDDPSSLKVIYGLGRPFVKSDYYAPFKGRNHYIHSTLGPSRVDVRFLGNYIVDVAHIRPGWNGCTHVDL